MENLYRSENRTLIDGEDAFQWYLKLAGGGNNDGQFILGNYYMNGIGTKKDEEKHFSEWNDFSLSLVVSIPVVERKWK
ncbi:hypothetical protein Glove_1033g34 [Diversispora epigaea]|uniref:Uncharacterized protein n=1 Tax=Diversispora epigaea TaxID=1348612 RepID=A0A397FXP4_9GLOM|nr:hypothetical protein Glove_1033g34 [Diversispora epigaea]